MADRKYFIADDDAFDPVTGLIRDGYKIRVPLMMADNLPIKPLTFRDVTGDGDDTRDVRRAERRARRAAAFPSTDDAVRITQAVLATKAVMRRDGFISDAEAAAHRPGFRYLPDAAGDDDGPRPRRRKTAVTLEGPDGHTLSYSTTEGEMSDGTMSARDAYIAETTNAWRGVRDVDQVTGSQTRAIPSMPVGAYAPVGFGAKAGDVVSFNGAPAKLVERGGWLYAEVIDVGATRSGRSSGGAPPTRSGDSAIVSDRSAQDSAWRALQEQTNNAWRS